MSLDPSPSRCLELLRSHPSDSERLAGLEDYLLILDRSAAALDGESSHLAVCDLRRLTLNGSFVGWAGIVTTTEMGTACVTARVSGADGGCVRVVGCFAE